MAMKEGRELRVAVWLVVALVIALVAVLALFWVAMPLSIGPMPTEAPMAPMAPMAMGACMALMTASTLITSLIVVVVAVLLVRWLLPWDRLAAAKQVGQ